MSIHADFYCFTGHFLQGEVEISLLNFKKEIYCSIFINFCFALAAVFYRHIDLNRYWLNVFSAFSWIDFAILVFFPIGLTYFEFQLIRILENHKSNEGSHTVTFSKKKWVVHTLIDALLLLVAWMPILITFYPGTVMQDEIYSMHWPLTTTNQPIVYNLLLFCAWKIGSFFSSPTFGLGALNFSQICLMALVLGYTIEWIGGKTSKAFKYLILIYYMFLPIISNIAATLIKDKLFAVILTAGIPLLYECCYSLKTRQNSKYPFYLLVIWGILLISIRNNGIYIWGSLMSIMLFCNLKQWKKLAGITFLAISLGMAPTIVWRIHGHTNPFQEAVAIPIQQIALAIKCNSFILKRDADYYESLLPLDLWRKSYNPNTPDFIKWNRLFKREKLNHTKKQFIRSWLSTIYYNPQIAIQAWLMETYGYWSFTSFPWPSGQSTMSCAATEEILNLKDPGGKVNGRFLVNSAGPIPQEMSRNIGLFNFHNVWYLGAGICFWIMTIAFTLCLFQKRREKLFAFLPVYLSWGTLMASVPTAFAFRYAYMYPLALPILIGLVFDYSKNTRSNCI